MKKPTQAEIEEKLRGEDLNSWLDLWRAEQGPAKPGALQLMAAVLPFPIEQSLRILDLGCGTGDAGRAIRSRFPNSSIDFVDRNEFFLALCAAVSRHAGISARTLMADLTQADWRLDLRDDYDVVVVVNTAHWFSLVEAASLFRDIRELLRPGGIFLLMEPVSAAPLFDPGFKVWQEGQLSQHKYEDWRRFWSRVNYLVGHDYGFLGDLPKVSHRIGDGLPVMHWVGLLTDAGFGSIDILLRDSEKVAFAMVRPRSAAQP